MAIEVTLYTDGSARGNPGPGGYGVVLMSGKHRREISDGYALTTNNRMELLAVIVGLEALKFDGCNVTLYSDSKYVIDAISKNWLAGWVKTNFKNKKNRDLWLRYLKVAQRHNIRCVWVKGHNGNPYNELCDRLATKASESSESTPLKDDVWYLRNMQSENGIF